MITKAPLDQDRVRKITGSFAFIEHRFLRNGFFSVLNHHELLLYVFLVLVADRNGLSYYSYDKICTVLRISVDELDGDFTVNRLYEELGGEMAKNAINDLGQQLQDAGWLLAGSGNKPRTCTDALFEQVALHYGE